jgi:lipopolysaccharide export system protein LptA
MPFLALIFWALFSRPVLAAAPVSVAALSPTATALSPTATALSGTATALSGTATALSGTATALSPTADSSSDTRVVAVRGDRLEYAQDGHYVVGEGHVAVRQGETELFADHIHIGLDDHWVEAEGNVVWCEGKQMVHAQRVRVNLKTKTGTAEGILYGQGPWVASGQHVEKTSEKDIFLAEGAFTSCDRRNPHYRIVAREIHLVVGEWMAVYGAMAYVGVVPVFYFPYFSRNLRDPRPPIIVMPGYDATNGMLVRTTYNYWLSPREYGSVQFDWMEKTGTGEGLTHYYRFDQGNGQVGGYYSRNPGTGAENWDAKVDHQQNLGKGYTLNGNFETVSSSTFNQQYGQSSVDSYQHSSWLDLRSAQKGYSWDLQSSQTVTTDPDSGQAYVSACNLPSASLQVYDRPLFAGSRLTRNLSMSLQHDYVGLSPNTATASVWTATGQAITVTAGGVTATASTLTFTSQAQTGWHDTLQVSPGLSYTQPLWRGNSLSLGFNPQAGWTLQELAPDGGDLTAGFATRDSLQTRWNRWCSSTLGWDLARQLLHSQPLPWSGLTQHDLNGRIDFDGRLGFSFSLASRYDLLPYDEPYDLFRLAPLTLDARWTPKGAGAKAGFNVLYDAGNGELQQWTGSLNKADPAGAWQWSLGMSWVNQRLAYMARSDPEAPAITTWAPESMMTADILRLNLGTSFHMTEHWRFGVNESVDLTNKHIDDQSLSIWRDLHCWELQATVHQRPDGSMEFTGGINLKALPNLRVGSGSVEALGLN